MDKVFWPIHHKTFATFNIKIWNQKYESLLCENKIQYLLSISDFAWIFAWLRKMQIYSHWQFQCSFMFEQMKMIRIGVALTTIIIKSKWTLCDTIFFENMNLIWLKRFDRLWVYLDWKFCTVPLTSLLNRHTFQLIWKKSGFPKIPLVC